MKKRLLAMLLAMLMVMGTLPMAAFAEDPPGDEVIAAPLSAGLDKVNTSVTIKSVTEDPTSGLTTIEVDVTDLIPSTHPDVTGNGQTYTPSATGYYVGIGIKNTFAAGEGHYFVARTSSKAANPKTLTYLYWPDDKTCTDNGKTYTTFYDTIPAPAENSTSSTKAHYMYLTTAVPDENGKLPDTAEVKAYYVSYTVKFKYGALAAYEEDSLVPANLTTVDNETGPEFGHAKEYSVEYDKNDMTIVIKATDLEKTKNDQTPPVEAYWVGVGVPHVDDAKYIWYFNDSQPTDTSYTSATRTQTNGTKTYDTFYFGWDTVAEIENTSNATLSVKKSNEIATYNISFDVTASNPDTTAVADNVVAANLTAGDKGPAPAYGHAAAYDVDYNKDSNEITVYATALEKTSNANSVDGNWVGVGMPKNDKAKYAWGFGTTVPTEFAPNANQPGADRVQTVEGNEYTTLYWDSDDWANKTGWVMVKEDGKAPVTYTVDFKVTLAGTAYADDDVKAANLTAVAGEQAPGFGHVAAGADGYKVTYVPGTKTITIHANELEKTNSTAGEAYWVGVALKNADAENSDSAYTYAYGKGALPTAKELAGKTYAKRDNTQAEGSTNYDTIYWGWTDATAAKDAKDGWLAVKDSGDKVVVYTVKFEITPKAEPTASISTVYGNDVAAAVTNSGLTAGNVLPYTITTTYENLKADGHYFLTVSKDGVIIGSAIGGNATKGSFSLLNTAQMELVSNGYKPSDLKGVCTVTLYEATEDVNGTSKSVGVDSDGKPTKAGVEFTAVATTTVTVTAPVIAATLADHPQGDDAEITGLGTVTVDMGGTYTQDAAQKVITIPVTLNGTNIKKHHNSAGDEGYWVGIGVPAGTGATYKAGWGAYDATTDNGSADNQQTEGGYEYQTFYFGYTEGKTEGYVAVTSNDVTVIYQITFSVTVDAGTVVTPTVPTVVEAPLVDHSADAKTGLGSVSVSIEAGEVEKTYNVTLTGNNIVEHENANNEPGFWVGFGMPIEDGQTYTYTLKGETDTLLGSVPSRIITDNQGHKYNTVYFDKNGTYTIEQAKDDTVVATYVVNVVINKAEGTAYAAGDVKAANLTAVEGLEGPEYGHATAYSVVYDPDTAPKTITINATGLEKTTNPGGATYYWVGLALKQGAGNEYAYGFGTKPAELTAEDYEAADSTQNDTFDTIYWGFGDSLATNGNRTGWLSVKSADGKVVDYTVNFVITVTGTVSAGLDENGKVDVDDAVIAGLVQAAIAGKNDNAPVEGAENDDGDPVATIVATGDNLTEASVDVSVATLTAAVSGDVSVALDVEGVGSMTLDPAAITAAVGSETTGTLTLEVANVTNDADFELVNTLEGGANADDALAIFTASVLKNGQAVEFTTSGTIKLVFNTGLTQITGKDKIEVYQDGVKVSADQIKDISGGILTLEVHHLSEFVIMPKAEENNPPSYTPTIPSTSSSSNSIANGSGSAEGGSWTTDKTSASAGDTVTITVTPDEGYKVGAVTVKDAQGNEVEVTKTEDGKYTFTMPKSKVEVSVSFTAIITFVDVKDDAYYADAVAWAVENDITNGMGNNEFQPNGSCTRAQIVTFLWRAMGSPEVEATIEFTDVEAGSYYEKAVAWAVANGVTNGTDETHFSPKQTCTRAQAVTFLWRAMGKPEVETSDEFNDVRADAYYADAVAWAVANEITNGTGNNNFSPKATCTRAQIVTFLWRTMA